MADLSHLPFAARARAAKECAAALRQMSLRSGRNIGAGGITMPHSGHENVSALQSCPRDCTVNDEFHAACDVWVQRQDERFEEMIAQWDLKAEALTERARVET